MKNALAVLAIAGVIIGSTPANASAEKLLRLEESSQLLEKGVTILKRGGKVAELTNDAKAVCPYAKRAADYYKRAFVLNPIPETLKVLRKVETMNRKYC